MKKNSQRRSKPKTPQKISAGLTARRAEAAQKTSVYDPVYPRDEEERKVGIVSGTPADAFDETAERKENKFVAIYISILAVLIAIAATGSNDAMKTAQQAGFQVNDQYAFYQAKLIRYGQFRLASDQIVFNLEQNAGMHPGTRAILEVKKKEYDNSADRIQSSHKGGLPTLLARAESCENLRDQALAQHPFYDYSLAMLQIAIVLASASIVTGRQMLLFGSFGVGAFGVLLFLNGYLLIWGQPELKTAKVEALQRSLGGWLYRAGAPVLSPILARCPLE